MADHRPFGGEPATRGRVVHLYALAVGSGGVTADEDCSSVGYNANVVAKDFDFVGAENVKAVAVVVADEVAFDLSDPSDDRAIRVRVEEDPGGIAAVPSAQL